jgi:hypothetical protein
VRLELGLGHFDDLFVDDLVITWELELMLGVVRVNVRKAFNG